MSIRIFQAGAFIHVHFCDKLINFLLPFPVLFFSFMKAKSQTFIFVVGHNRERGEIEQERVEEGEIDPHTPLFINITYTKKRPSFRQNSWCAKGRMVPWLGVLIKQYCRRFIPPSLYSLLTLVFNDHV